MTKKVLTAAIAAAAATAAITVSAAAYAGEANQVNVDGIAFEIPAEYSGLLTVRTDGLGEGELVSVSETASIEAAEANGETDHGAGWLFSISRVPEDELLQLRCGDMSGMEVFAEDDDMYYLYNHPTDVRMVRATNEEMTADMDQWTALNEWAAGDVRQEILEGNPELDAETFTNTTLDMLLARAAYKGDVQYEIRSLELGGESIDMTGRTDEIKDLADDATFEAVTDVETPDGEYIVVAFNDNGDEIRYDFFTAPEAANLIRETRTLGNEEFVCLYKATFEDPEETAYGEVHEWIEEYLHGGDVDHDDHDGHDDHDDSGDYDDIDD